MNGGRYIFGILLLSCLLAGMASAGLTIGVPTIVTGNMQTLTAQTSGGVGPYTFNFLVYNPSNILTYNDLVTLSVPQPDAILQYSNGLVIGYYATSNTNTGRGNALMQAVGNESCGANIYLPDVLPKTYFVDQAYIPNQFIDLGLMYSCTQGNSISIYGAGKLKTELITNTIVSSFADGDALLTGNGTTVADLTINSINSSQGGSGLGIVYDYGASNIIIRNVEIYAPDVGINVGCFGSCNNINIYNDTIFGDHEGIRVDQNNGIVNIYDSNIMVNGKFGYPSQQADVFGIRIGYQYWSQIPGAGANTNFTQTNIVNTIVIATNGTQFNNGTSTFGYSNTVVDTQIYGGNFFASGTANSALYQGVKGTGAATLAANGLTTYNTHHGTISSLPGGYGSYSYDQTPLIPPSLVFPNSTIFTYTQNAPAGSWNAVVIAKDSAANTATSYQTYNVVNTLTFNAMAIAHSAIGLGGTQVITSYVYNGASPYSYNLLVYNSTGSVFSQIFSNFITYNSVAFIQNPTWGIGSFTANVYVSDSATVTERVSNSLGYMVLSTTTTIPQDNTGGLPGTTSVRTTTSSATTTTSTMAPSVSSITVNQTTSTVVTSITTTVNQPPTTSVVQSQKSGVESGMFAQIGYSLSHNDNLDLVIMAVVVIGAALWYYISRRKRK